jgi:hypothetical protein
MQKKHEELVKVRLQKRGDFFRKLWYLHEELKLATTALSLCDCNSKRPEDEQMGRLTEYEVCNSNVARLQEKIHVHEAIGRGKRRKLAVGVTPWYGVSKASLNWT